MIYSGTKIVDILDNLIHECLNGVSSRALNYLEKLQQQQSYLWRCVIIFIVKLRLLVGRTKSDGMDL